MLVQSSYTVVANRRRRASFISRSLRRSQDIVRAAMAVVLLLATVTVLKPALIQQVLRRPPAPGGLDLEAGFLTMLG